MEIWVCRLSVAYSTEKKTFCTIKKALRQKKQSSRKTLICCVITSRGKNLLSWYRTLHWGQHKPMRQPLIFYFLSPKVLFEENEEELNQNGN